MFETISEIQELKELLMATNHEKLVDILISLYISHGYISNQLDMIFAGLDADPNKIISAIKEEIAFLKRSTKFINYNESYFFANNLDALRLIIINDLLEKSLEAAFDMMLNFLDLHENTLERVHDDGNVSDVFIQACEDLGLLGQKINHLKMPEIVEIVFWRFMHNHYGVYDNIILYFKDALKDEGLNLLQAKLKQSTNEENTDKIQDGLRSIADCKK